MQLQKDVRKLEEKIAEIKQQVSRTRDNDDLIAELTVRIEGLEAEKADVAAQIPEDWEENYNTFNGLIRAEDKARNEYRRAADGSYEKAAEFVAILDQNDNFRALKGKRLVMWNLMMLSQRSAKPVVLSKRKRQIKRKLSKSMKRR